MIQSSVSGITPQFGNISQLSFRRATQLLRCQSSLTSCPLHWFGKASDKNINNRLNYFATREKWLYFGQYGHRQFHLASDAISNLVKQSKFAGRDKKLLRQYLTILKQSTTMKIDIYFIVCPKNHHCTTQFAWAFLNRRTIYAADGHVESDMRVCHMELRCLYFCLRTI